MHNECTLKHRQGGRTTLNFQAQQQLRKIWFCLAQAHEEQTKTVIPNFWISSLNLRRCCLKTKCILLISGAHFSPSKRSISASKELKKSGVVDLEQHSGKTDVDTLKGEKVVKIRCALGWFWKNESQRFEMHHLVFATASSWSPDCCDEIGSRQGYFSFVSWRCNLTLSAHGHCSFWRLATTEVPTFFQAL